jgi:hypothetical protein
MGMLATLCMTACSDDNPATTTYLPQTTEDNVLENLIRAYNDQDIEGYSRLFASDYQWYMDPTKRKQLGIEFWTRTTDSLQAEALFSSPHVTRIDLRIDWTRGSATSSGFLPRPCEWTKLSIADLTLDVDVTCPDRGSTTFRVENQLQRLFFRRGRACPTSDPADTLLYIVEWRDEGSQAKPMRSSPAVEMSTWSSIMSEALNCE